MVAALPLAVGVSKSSESSGTASSAGVVAILTEAGVETAFVGAGVKATLVAAGDGTALAGAGVEVTGLLLDATGVVGDLPYNRKI